MMPPLSDALGAEHMSQGPFCQIVSHVQILGVSQNRDTLYRPVTSLSKASSAEFVNNNFRFVRSVMVQTHIFVGDS